jgi:hypothetical protein
MEELIFLNFSEAWEIMKNGGSVTNPDTFDYFLLVDGYIERHDDESGVLITRYEMIPYGFMRRDDWEEVDENLEEADAEECHAIRCPNCKILEYYYGVDFEVPETCKHCGRKFKVRSRKNDTPADSLFRIKLPSLKIDTNLPKGTLYMRNDTAEKMELVFGKFRDDDRIERHREWLRKAIEEAQKDISDCIPKGNHWYLLGRLEALERCLMELNKQD